MLPEGRPRSRSGVVAPLLALAIGLGNCTTGLRYQPAQPLDVAGNSQRQLGKLALLWPHFVRQENETSCSVAAVTTVLNAALTQRRRQPVAQHAVVETDPTGGWARATGDDHSPGVTLDRLGMYTLQAFYSFGLKRVAVDVNHVADTGVTTVQTLMSVLDKNEKLGETYFVIVNFAQSAYFRDGEPVGHMSVVGAYDSARERVLILDVDARPVQPYWVSLAQFVAGMQTADDETGEPRGYLVIRLG